jgi:hypothetical protein
VAGKITGLAFTDRHVVVSLSDGQLLGTDYKVFSQ